MPERHASPPPTLAEAFGQVLRQLREQDGPRSQEQLGEQAGLHRTSMSHWERGIGGSPTLVTIFRIAETLGLSAAEIVARIEALRPRLPERKPRYDRK